MTEKQLNLYDRLINEPSNDWDIYHWATGTGAGGGRGWGEGKGKRNVESRTTWADLSLELYPRPLPPLYSCKWTFTPDTVHFSKVCNVYLLS